MRQGLGWLCTVLWPVPGDMVVLCADTGISLEGTPLAVVRNCTRVPGSPALPAPGASLLPLSCTLSFQSRRLRYLCQSALLCGVTCSEFLPWPSSVPCRADRMLPSLHS